VIELLTATLPPPDDDDDGQLAVCICGLSFRLNELGNLAEHLIAKKIHRWRTMARAELEHKKEIGSALT
jgi:hypothetical protein